MPHTLMHNWYIMHTHNMEHTWKGIIYFDIVSVWNKTNIYDVYEHLTCMQRAHIYSHSIFRIRKDNPHRYI